MIATATVRSMFIYCARLAFKCTSCSLLSFNFLMVQQHKHTHTQTESVSKQTPKERDKPKRHTEDKTCEAHGLAVA